jgi:bacterioferritin
MLNDALTSEYKASIQYLHHYNNVRSKHTDVINHFKAHMEDEQYHAQLLVQRIYTLGGTPVLDLNQFADFTDDIDVALGQDVKAETEAVEIYSKILEYTEEIKDFATTMMIESILATEVSHLDEFAKILGVNVESSDSEEIGPEVPEGVEEPEEDAKEDKVEFEIKEEE